MHRLREFVRDLTANSQPRLPWRRIVLAAVGTGGAVALLGLAGSSIDLTLVFLAFAPSCLLVLVLPEAPVSQPIAVLGGHLVSATVGLGISSLPHDGWWVGPLAATASVLAMLVLRVLHPPAVANAVIVSVTSPGWGYLLAPALPAAVLIVVFGLIWHRFTGGQYPQRSRLR